MPPHPFFFACAGGRARRTASAFACARPRRLDASWTACLCGRRRSGRRRGPGLRRSCLELWTSRHAQPRWALPTGGREGSSSMRLDYELVSRPCLYTKPALP
eukprot:scaffold15425_cov110-Isochrysis_galbana.AAC.9